MNEILIDGVIGTGEGEISSSMVKAQIAQADRSKPLVVRIHSEGGSVFEGFAIYDAFASYDGPKRAVIESTAFSISSFIPMAFDDVEISPNGYMMLHNPSVRTEGDDDDLSQSAEMLKGLKQNMVSAYAKRTGKSEEEITAILKKETYFNAQQALDAGLVTKVTESPVNGRVFAKLNNLPHGVVAALFGADPSGQSPAQPKVPPMASEPSAAASIKEIRAAYPKAKSEFILRCVEKEMPMASVAKAAADELTAENEELQARVAALEEELTETKAKAAARAEDDEEVDTEGDDETEVDAEEDEDTTPSARRRTGANPVAKGRRTSGPSAKQRWDEAVATQCKRYPNNRTKAVAQANALNPGLRQAMLAEVNAR